jgi:hypothetical protein
VALEHKEHALHDPAHFEAVVIAELAGELLSALSAGVDPSHLTRLLDLIASKVSDLNDLLPDEGMTDALSPDDPFNDCLAEWPTSIPTWF